MYNFYHGAPWKKSSNSEFYHAKAQRCIIFSVVNSSLKSSTCLLHNIFVQMSGQILEINGIRATINNPAPKERGMLFLIRNWT